MRELYNETNKDGKYVALSYVYWNKNREKEFYLSDPINADVTDSDKQNFKKLLAGRIDIFPSGLVNGYSILRKDFDASESDLISFHPKPLSKTTGHLAFTRSSKNFENLLRIFNQGLAELKKEGLYNKFRDDLLAGKYGQ